MDASDLQTTKMHLLLDRLRGGDRQAEDELVRRIYNRMQRLCHTMLRGYTQVRSVEETADVMQQALMRFLRSLRELRPASTREFFGLASEQIRRELLDLAKFYRRGRRDLGKVAPRQATADDSGRGDDPSIHDNAPENLEAWEAFHGAVASLPADERECVGLIYYHGWQQAEVADLFQVTERTVRRWWVSACLKIKERLGRDMPDVA